MLIESFSQKVIASGIFHTYIATGFFATLIFFIINADLFTPWEMTFGTIVITIALKGVSNMMLSLVILLYNLKHTHEKHNFKTSADKLELLVNELQLQETRLKAASVTKEI